MGALVEGEDVGGDREGVLEGASGGGHVVHVRQPPPARGLVEHHRRGGLGVVRVGDEAGEVADAAPEVAAELRAEDGGEGGPG
jgi:hypothetical protein